MVSEKHEKILVLPRYLEKYLLYNIVFLISSLFIAIIIVPSIVYVNLTIIYTPSSINDVKSVIYSIIPFIIPFIAATYLFFILAYRSLYRFVDTLSQSIELLLELYRDLDPEKYNYVENVKPAALYTLRNSGIMKLVYVVVATGLFGIVFPILLFAESPDLGLVESSSIILGLISGIVYIVLAFRVAGVFSVVSKVFMLDVANIAGDTLIAHAVIGILGSIIPLLGSIFATIGFILFIVFLYMVYRVKELLRFKIEYLLSQIGYHAA